MRKVVRLLRRGGELGESDAGTFELLVNKMCRAVNPDVSLVDDPEGLFTLLEAKNWDVKDSAVKAEVRRKRGREEEEEEEEEKKEKKEKKERKEDAEEAEEAEEEDRKEENERDQKRGNK